MPITQIITGQTFEGADASIMSRVNFDGANIVQADVASIAFKLYKKKDPATLIQSGALVVADTIFDTLQTDGRWTTDSTGYNFRHIIAGADLADPDEIYRAEYVITGTGGEKKVVVAEITTLAMIGS
jgi:hypothetical protein